MKRIMLLVLSEILHIYGGCVNLILRSLNRPLKPKALVFEVTDACNSHCIHCDVWRKKPTKDLLTCEEIEKTLEGDLFKNLQSILLTGGEPVLRDDLEEMILTIHKILPKARFTLSTNALLPQRVINVVRTAIEHEVDISVGVSLDGVGEKHDLIRGMKGNFKKVDYLLHELIALKEKHKGKIELTIGFTLSNFTLDSLRETMLYAQRLDVRFLVQAYDENTYYGNVGKKILKANDDLIKAVASLVPSSHTEIWLKVLRKKPASFMCAALNSFCLLRSNGDIVPCLRLAEERIGNVREWPPFLIWSNSKSKQVRKLVKNCKGCLNDWGTKCSFDTYYFPVLKFRIKRMFRKLFYNEDYL